jgi:hypothetical protein
VDNAIVVRHGLIPPYTPPQKKPDFVGKYRFVLFSPSRSSVDTSFIEKMLQSDKFLEYLEKNNILLILRSPHLQSRSPNVIILSHFMAQDEYEATFFHADAILLTYPSSFKYRISAVMLEALSCNKLALMSDMDVFRQYEDIYGKEAYYSSVDGLISSIDHLMNCGQKSIKLNDEQRKSLMIDYSDVLSIKI